MSKEQTQRDIIEYQLGTFGEVSRNACLRGDYGPFITRLSAIILDMKKDEHAPWEIEDGFFRKDERRGGQDFIYRLIKKPPYKNPYAVEGKEETEEPEKVEGEQGLF